MQVCWHFLHVRNSSTIPVGGGMSERLRGAWLPSGFKPQQWTWRQSIKRVPKTGLYFLQMNLQCLPRSRQVSRAFGISTTNLQEVQDNFIFLGVQRKEGVGSRVTGKKDWVKHKPRLPAKSEIPLVLNQNTKIMDPFSTCPIWCLYMNSGSNWWSFPCFLRLVPAWCNTLRHGVKLIDVHAPASTIFIQIPRLG